MCRHIRLLYGKPLAEEEVTHFKHNIRTSCLESLTKILSECMDEHKITSEHLQACKEFLDESKSNCNRDRNYLDKAVAIWRNSTLQNYILEMTPQHYFSTEVSSASQEGFHSPARVNKNQCKLNSDHPAYHLLPSFSRIMSKGYYPTLDDILSIRIPTTGK